MNKKLKISLLIIVGIVVIGAGSVGYKYYPLYKNITSNPSDGDGETTETVTENPFDKIGSTETDGQDQADVERDEQGNIIEKDGKDSESNNESNKENETNKAKRKTEEQKIIEEQAKDPEYVNIVEPYKQRFQNLQAKQEGQLNALVEQGKAEYIEAKKNGKSPASLTAKYGSEAVKLENRSQKEFNNLRDELRNDLKGHSYDPALVTEVEGYYKQRKNSMQSEILGK